MCLYCIIIESEIEELLLFDKLNNMVDEQLIKQKQFIWDNIKNEEKNNNINFNKLCSFGNDFKIDNNNQLRQDKIKNGIIPLKTINELHIINSKIKDDYNYEKINYDLFTEHNNNVYLTQLVCFFYVYLFMFYLFEISRNFYIFNIVNI